MRQFLVRVPRLKRLTNKDFLETRHNAWSGWFERGDGSRLYVNRGLGRFRRISFFCPPELTVWDLVPGDHRAGLAGARA